MKVGLTNREAIYSLKHAIVDNGPLSNEASLTNRELFYLLLRYRAVVLGQKQRDRRYTLSRHNVQTIGCIPLETVDAHDCPSLPESGFEFKRTKLPVPKTIGNFTSVISIANTENYDYIQWDAIQDLQHSRFKAERNKIFYTMKTGKDGTYIYLYNEKHGSSIAVSGIFENPLEVQNFPDCDGVVDNCFSPMDQEFIVDPELMPIIIDMVLANKFKYRQPVVDIYNNDQDDTAAIKPPHGNR
jgi:hypothetical protein